MEDLFINALAGFIFALIFIPLGRWYLKRKKKNQIEADDKLSKEEIKEFISTSHKDELNLEEEISSLRMKSLSQENVIREKIRNIGYEMDKGTIDWEEYDKKSAILKKEINDLEDKLKNSIQKLRLGKKAKEEIQETSPTSPKDLPKEIERYFELKEKGIITEDEFNKKKKELLK